MLQLQRIVTVMSGILLNYKGTDRNQGQNFAILSRLSRSFVCHLLFALI